MLRRSYLLVQLYSLSVFFLLHSPPFRTSCGLCSYISQTVVGSCLLPLASTLPFRNGSESSNLYMQSLQVNSEFTIGLAAMLSLRIRFLNSLSSSFVIPLAMQSLSIPFYFYIRITIISLFPACAGMIPVTCNTCSCTNMFPACAGMIPLWRLPLM